MKLNINKRGQLGKIFSANVVLIILVFLMAIYLVLVGFVVGIKKPDIPSFINVELGDVLFREINFSVDNKNEKMLIFDALIGYWNGKIDINLIENALKDFVKNDAIEGHCLAIAQGDEMKPAGLTGGSALDDFFIEFKNGEIYSGHTGSKPYQLNVYEEKGEFGEISFSILDKKRIYVQYYYGRCLDEK